ncbi:MAG: hypothetical protein ACKV0T_02430 [Planctomycetales bacterium]
MEHDELFDRWRQARSGSEPSDEFAERVMRGIAADGPPVVTRVADRSVRLAQAARWLRTVSCAAALAVGLLRIAEFLSLLAATQIAD